eukprot:scaffold44145_cov16-Tisochrysis_lutea.AAC.1
MMGPMHYAWSLAFLWFQFPLCTRGARDQCLSGTLVKLDIASSYKEHEEVYGALAHPALGSALEQEYRGTIMMADPPDACSSLHELPEGQSAKHMEITISRTEKDFSWRTLLHTVFQPSLPWARTALRCTALKSIGKMKSQNKICVWLSPNDGSIVLVARGTCSFKEKALAIQVAKQELLLRPVWPSNDWCCPVLCGSLCKQEREREVRERGKGRWRRNQGMCVYVCTRAQEAKGAAMVLYDNHPGCVSMGTEDDKNATRSRNVTIPCMRWGAHDSQWCKLGLSRLRDAGGMMGKGCLTKKSMAGERCKLSASGCDYLAPVPERFPWPRAFTWGGMRAARQRMQAVR